MTTDNTSSAPIGVGVWGLGRHAIGKLLPALSASPGVRIAAVATRDQQVLEEQAERWECTAQPSLEALLEDAGVQAVVVATPIGRHYADGRKVLEAGRHLWCEKAFTATTDEAEALVGLATEKDLSLCVSCPPLFHPQFDCLRRLLRDSSLGTLRGISARFGFPHLEAGDSRYDPAVGGGALLDMGFYTIALPAALMDEVPKVAGATMTTESGYAVDTAGAALLTFSGGVAANAEWGYGRDYVNEITLWGEQASATAFPAFSKPAHLTPSVVIRRQNTEEPRPVEDREQFEAMFAAFAATLGDSGERRRFRDDALAQQKLLDAVAAASAA